MSVRNHRVLAPLLALLAACGVADESFEMSSDELAVDRVPLPTLHTTLRAGDPYSPILDEPPLTVGGAEPCLESPEVVTTAGTTTVEASIVTTQRELLERLDLGVSGVPVNLGRLVGGSGTARLAVETKLSEGSVSLMFQAKGTFESALVGVGAEPRRFDPARIPRCGWGYVRKAYHRLAAVVIVQIQSHRGADQVRIGCGAAETGCTPASLSAGPVAAKVALERTLRSGSYDVSVRSVADVIPGLAPMPLGNMVALSSTPETADVVIEKLGRALDWLGGAQATIAQRVDALSSATESAARAPTAKVDFVYWPGLSSELRDRLARSYDDVVGTRTDYARTLARAAAWEVFSDARAEGRGHLYNVPTAPLPTVEALDARARELLDPDGLLTARRRELESSLDRCDDAVRNESGDAAAAALVTRVQRACERAPVPSWDASYDAVYGLRRLAPRSSVVRSYDEWRDDMCPAGQRIPHREEAALLGPFSHATARDQNRGVWVRRENLLANPLYVKAGKVERVGLFQAPEHVTLCFAGDSLFE